jgi:hypothetical protein
VINWPLSPLPSLALDHKMHHRCRCHIDKIPLVFTGTAISNQTDDANWIVSYHGMLPHQLITKPVERILRSILKEKNRTTIGHRVTGDKSAELLRKLPSASGRIWYEVDLDDNGDNGGPERLLYSNDGLFFAMFDHTFVIVVMESKVYEKKQQENVMLSTVEPIDVYIT